MIIYEDNELLININAVFYLTLRMDTYKRNPNDVKNNYILKHSIATFINSLNENNQYLLDKAYNYLGYKPEGRYSIKDIKKLYDTL